MKLVQHVTGNGKELRNVLLEIVSGTPGSGLTAGRFWYDSAAGRLKYRDGSGTLTPWVANADIPDGTITNVKLATNPLARANHTGTQTASTISDFDTQVRTSRLDQMAAPTTAVSMNSQRLTSLATPTGASDAATKQYVDDAVAGLSWKDEVRVATTAAGTLASSFANGQSVDGVTLATGDRILIKNQASGSENGIYTVNASGAPTRATDADTAAEVIGSAVYVANGTTNGGTRWVNSNTGSITLNTTALTFVQFGGGSTYTAGNGLTLSSNDFNVGAGTGISVGADTVSIDTAVVPRFAKGTIGDGTSTTLTITHNLGTTGVMVEIYEVSSGDTVYADITRATSNTVTATFATAPTTNQYGYVVLG